MTIDEVQLGQGMHRIGQPQDIGNACLVFVSMYHEDRGGTSARCGWMQSPRRKSSWFA